MIERARRHAARPWAAIALACTVVLMQALGFAHAVLHPPKAPHALHVAHAHDHDHGHKHDQELDARAAPRGDHDHGLEFAGHGLDDESTCRLYDQLSHGEATHAALALPLRCAAPAALPGWVPHLRADGPAPRRFLARAPPRAA